MFFFTQNLLYVFASSLCTSAVVDVVVVVVAVVVVVVVVAVVVVGVVGGGVGAVVYCRVNVIFSLEVVSTVDVVDVVVVAVVVGVVDVVSGGIDVETLRIETSICSIRENSENKFIIHRKNLSHIYYIYVCTLYNL